jgi:tetratricopeptide (TPR) repeat protein
MLRLNADRTFFLIQGVDQSASSALAVFSKKENYDSKSTYHDPGGVMLFGLFGKKDHRHYLTQGGKHLAAERYADARLDFLEALSLCPASAADDEREIRNGLNAAANGLGQLNLHEGERSVNAGDLEKAVDHFTLAVELAFDETIKAMARERLKGLQQDAEMIVIDIPAAPAAAAPAPAAAPVARGPYAAYAASASGAAQAKTAEPPHQHGSKGGDCGCGGGQDDSHSHSHSHGGGCGGSCGGHGGGVVDADSGSHLSDEERFLLLTGPLGPELADRYAALGEKFQRAYLMIQDGNDAGAFPILQEMLVSGENDVVIFELALIMYRSQRLHEAETLLKRSLAMNETNPMTNISLVQLLAECGKVKEALGTANRMLELNVVPDQALVMQGDLYQALGDQANAMESWSNALKHQSVARNAAERLIPILDAQGRQNEAKFLVKTYMKSCGGH